MNEEKVNRAKGRLRLSKSKLTTLLKITNSINENSSRDQLFGILQDVLIQDLSIGKFVLYTFEVEWKIALIQGVENQNIENVDILDISGRYSKIESLTNEKQAGLSEFDIVIPVSHKEIPLAYLFLADIEDSKIEISPIIKHLQFIQTLANIIVVALENKRLNKEYIKQIAFQKELELAQNMQSLLFPRKLPNNAELKVDAFYLPHSEVGGDYYDVVSLQNGTTALCIADVSGKGMPAALLMANFQANLRALLNVTESIEELVKLCNKKVIESANYEKFITFFIAIFDPKKKELTYLNAGHQPAILLHSNTTRLLTKGCTVLGMFDELPNIETESVKLDQNSILACFTDGLTELETEKGIQLESEGVEELIAKATDIDTMGNSLKKEVERLSSISEASDDITWLIARFLS